VLKEVEACLADGQRVEMYIAKSICSITGTNFEDLPIETGLKFSIEIDNLIQRYQTSYEKEYIADLATERQKEFIDELVAIMGELNIPSSQVTSFQREIVKETSIKLALIYRDWQQAIGDLMIIKQPDHSYEVLSFKAFESEWSKDHKCEGKLWLQRAERISRILICVLTATHELIKLDDSMNLFTN
jgi:hypothetical protein